MKLFLGVLAIMVAVNLFCILLIGARNPKPARWKSEELIANLYLPVIMFIGIVGLASVVQVLMVMGETGVSGREIGAAVFVIVIGILMVKTMKIGRRLAAFDKQSVAGPAPLTVLPNNETPEPPAIDRRAA